MNIKVNAIEKTITITDDLKSHYLMLTIICVLNLFSAVIQLLDRSKTDIVGKDIIFIVIGSGSIILMYIILLKKTTLNNIPIDAIERLSDKKMFWKKQYGIRLKNGRFRDLKEIKTQKEFNELKELVERI
jgi:3-hydroxy-3-methylglutaryl CoA synthase